MSLSSTTNRNDYVGNGAVDTYSYSFRIFDQSHLRVIVKETATGEETTLVINTDYTVTGVGESAGGTIVLVDNSQDWIDAEGDLATGWELTVRRVVPITQITDIRNQGDFYPEVHEDVFDKQIMISQQQQDDLDRAARMPQTVSASVFDPQFPADLPDNPGAVVIVNPAGDGFVTGPTADAIEQASADAAAAAASATDAGEHATTASRWAKFTGGTVIDADTLVDSLEYSAKEYAQGTTSGVLGSAKDWAQKTSAAVTGSLYSAKEWAIGILTRGLSGGGSAKDWANYTGGTVDDTEYSAKKYAQDAAASAASAQWDDVSFKVFADSPIAITDGDAGTLFVIDCTGGNVVVNLPTISGLTLTNPWSIGFKKSDSTANTITVNRGSTDLIDGATSITIEDPNSGFILVPDTDPAPDYWTSVAFGDLSVLYSPTINTPTTDIVTWNDQGSTPSNPAAGFYKTYVKTDGRMYILNPSGLEQQLGSGGGGGALQWIEDAIAPIPDVENNAQVYKYTAADTQYLYTFVKVHSSYSGGTQIKLKLNFYSPDTTGNVLLQSLATLIEPGSSAVDTTTNQRTSTNSAVSLSGTANRVEAIELDLTDSVGAINSVAVAAGDLIKVRLTRGTDTATSDVRALVYGAEPTFS